MKCRTHQGFSLVELMVALLLGSLLTLAAVQLLGTNQRTFRLQQALLDIQEQGRFALDYIARDLRIMGYTAVDATGTPLVPDVGLKTASFTVGGATYPGSADDEGGSGNDRLTFSFFGTEDCEGDTLVTEGEIVNSYWVQNSELRCVGSASASTSGVVLLGGVDSFQVLYGIDEVGDDIPFASRYVAPSSVGGAPVVSVRLALLVSSETNQPDFGAPEDFVVLDEQIDGPTQLVADRIRRLFTTTVKARNYNWEAI